VKVGAGWTATLVTSHGPTRQSTRTLRNKAAQRR